MSLAQVVLTTATIAANAFVAVADFARARFVLVNSAAVPHAWLPALGAAKAAGALGLLLGLVGMPFLGPAAAVGLVAYYVGAVVVHLRSGDRSAKVAFPGAFLLLAIGSLAVSLAS